MELLSGRPVKNLLPSIRTEHELRRDEGIKDKDAIKKMKEKLYSNERRHAKSTNIRIGDHMMLKNYDAGKLAPQFGPERFKVISLTGSDATVENDEGHQQRRSVTHLKKWSQLSRMQNPIPET